jgi:hypothetical protein
MRTSEEYRREATRLREKARAEADPAARAELIAAAGQYDQMAEEIEDRERPSKSQSP